MKQKQILLLLLVLSLCLEGCQSSTQDVSDAYEQRDKIDIAVTEAASYEQSTGVAKESVSRETPRDTIEIHSDVLNVGDEIRYMGIHFQIHQVMKAQSIEELDQIMDAEEAKELKQRILSLDSGRRLGMDDTGRIRKKDEDSLLFIRCSYTNTGTQEIRLNMQQPLYMSRIDLRRLGEKHTVELGKEFDRNGQVVEFSGRHDEYISPGVGVATSNRFMYHVLKPQETFDTTEVINVINMNTEKYQDATYYISSYSFTNRSILYLPQASYLLPIEIPKD